jgi:dihydroxy-acid dehydratase
MEDFHAAGGMPVLLKVLEPLLDTSVRGVTGSSLGELLAVAQGPGDWQTTIRTLEKPLGPSGTLATVRGTLAPEGALIKVAAASQDMLRHRGAAVVFESPEDLDARLDDPGLEIRPESVLILRNAGPVGAGMPEAGYIPIPRRLAEAGVKDMVRVTDARMSGTAYGTVVLHCAPEAAVGGPLALVRDGDMISLDADERRLDLEVDPEELSRRRAALTPPEPPGRGWRALYARKVLPAPLGADLDFLGPEEKK